MYSLWGSEECRDYTFFSSRERVHLSLLSVPLGLILKKGATVLLIVVLVIEGLNIGRSMSDVCQIWRRSPCITRTVVTAASRRRTRASSAEYRRERTRGRGSVAFDTVVTTGDTGADAPSFLISGSSRPHIACMSFIRFVHHSCFIRA